MIVDYQCGRRRMAVPVPFHRNARIMRNALERLSIGNQQVIFLKKQAWNTFIAHYQLFR